jgi:predicted acyltransferase
VASGRLLSLDVFRGITIAGMLLVNNAGDWDHIFQPLEHAAWHGCTATDLIFPSFLFIMGVAMSFSFSRRSDSTSGSGRMLLRILRRTVILFALGLALNGMAYWALHNPGDPGGLRILGVLQRIAICYFVVAMFLLAGIRPVLQAILGIVLLLIYHCLMKHVNVPGYGRGVLENPGNLASWIDNRLLGPHAYELNEKTGTWHDPEGLLSTIPAIASTLSGTIAGTSLRDKLRTGYEKVAVLFVCGCSLIVISRLWAYQFPYNKNLWSPSYVLLSSGWAMNALAACMWLVDLTGQRTWATQFLIFGMNPIVT